MNSFKHDAIQCTSLIVSSKIVKTVQWFCPELRELIIYDSSVLLFIRGSEMECSDESVLINQIFPLIPSVTSFHYFNPCKLNYEVMLKNCPTLTSLSLGCEWAGSNYESASSLCDFIIKHKELESLCVSACILQSKKSVEEPDRYSFKRKRKGYSFENTNDDAITFKNVLTTCTSLRQLEILNFNGNQNIRLFMKITGGILENVSCITPDISCQCLTNIGNLSLLTKLVLEDVPIVNGELFKSLADGCSKLVSLKIKDLGAAAIRCMYLNELSYALPKLKNLQDFTMQQNYILPLTNIFEALQRCSNLRRIYINNQKDDHTVDFAAFGAFMACSLKLRFAHFIFRMTQMEKRSMKSRLKKCVYPHLMWILQTHTDKLDGIGGWFYFDMCLFRPLILTQFNKRN